MANRHPEYDPISGAYIGRIQYPTHQLDPNSPSATMSALRGGAHGLTFGGDKYIQGAGMMAMDWLAGMGTPGMDRTRQSGKMTWADAMNSLQELQQQDKLINPRSYSGGQIAGNIAGVAGGGGYGALKGAGLVKNLLRSRTAQNALDEAEARAQVRAKEPPQAPADIDYAGELTAHNKVLKDWHYDPSTGKVFEYKPIPNSVKGPKEITAAQFESKTGSKLSDWLAKRYDLDMGEYLNTPKIRDLPTELVDPNAPVKAVLPKGW